MRQVFQKVCIVSDHSTTYEAFGLPVIPDLVKNAGPMGGIHAALHASRPENVFIVGCDIPFVSQALIRHILRMGEGTSACTARLDGHIHPLCGFFSQACIPEIDEHVNSGRLKLLDFLDAIDARAADITADLPFYTPNLLININDLSTFHALGGEDHQSTSPRETP
jgi:molybdopterin-guanine dinucleotide biosynthesis protein A